HFVVVQRGRAMGRDIVDGTYVDTCFLYRRCDASAESLASTGRARNMVRIVYCSVAQNLESTFLPAHVDTCGGFAQRHAVPTLIEWPAWKRAQDRKSTRLNSSHVK